MTPERWQQISRIFKSAILLDNEARAAYVESQCGRDDSLRVEVEKLIDSHGKADADEFMNGVAAEAAAPLLTDDEAKPETYSTSALRGWQRSMRHMKRILCIAI